MDFLLRKGQDFEEEFNFKDTNGKPIPLPRAKYRLVLERGSYAREYVAYKGLTKNANGLVWNISEEESADFVYNTLYYTLFMDETELARGVLKIQ